MTLAVALAALGCSGAPGSSADRGEGGAPADEERTEPEALEPLPWNPPEEATPVEHGSHELVGPTTEPPPVVDERDCNGRVYGIVRDFTDQHPDFETFSGSTPSLGMVLPELGADEKPVHTSDPLLLGEGGGYVGDNGQQTSSAASFAAWYNDSEACAGFFIELTFVTNADGSYSFGGPDFYPVDGAGFGNQDRLHNFHFTTELRVEFQYREGASLTFTGDDDLWVFINGRLAMDLGGLHASYTGELRLDEHAVELGLELGQVYRLDLFHAERHTSESNFRVDTNFAFTNCGVFVGLEK